MRKRWLPVVLIIMLVVIGTIAVGCGSSKKSKTENAAKSSTPAVEPKADHSTVANEAAEADIPWINLKGIVDLVNLVQEMTWTIDEDTFVYAHLGTESVKGVQTDVIQIEVTGEYDDEDERVVFWVDSSGRIMRALMNDVDTPTEMLEHMSVYLLAPLLPFQLSSEQNLQLALSGKNVPGWTVTDRGKKRETIGGKSVDVSTIEIQAKDMFSTGAGEYTIQFRFGDFGNMRLLLGWNVLDGGQEGEDWGRFSIETITFR
ncbi:hypothetical protein [Desulfitibacter alkalitolerans]|uniref:hypothetical protein n=1 Tax=Desulfitibacter alkalitolerans TaxID=264641 RepID=UPI000480A179|nr:hypothetical protein [Desulfitibacter alkalitolerans]